MVHGYVRECAEAFLRRAHRDPSRPERPCACEHPCHQGAGRRDLGSRPGHPGRRGGRRVGTLLLDRSRGLRRRGQARRGHAKHWQIDSRAHVNREDFSGMNSNVTRALKVVGLAVGALALGGAAYGGVQVSQFDASMDKVYDVPVPSIVLSTDATVIARGKHLVESGAGCARLVALPRAGPRGRPAHRHGPGRHDGGAQPHEREPGSGLLGRTSSPASSSTG